MKKRVTIVDVAERAGVAISSASAALNGRPGVSEATRLRVRDAADTLGFVPSVRGRSLSARRAFAVGLVVQREVEVLEADPFFGAFIGGIEEVLPERGYALVLQVSADAHRTELRYRELGANRRVDGVILNELQVDDPRIPLVGELELPAVGINADEATMLPFPAVRQDGGEALTRLVATLVTLGHRRVAHVSGPLEYVHTWQRRRAWERALTGAGLRPGRLVVGDFTFDSGRAAADELLTLPADERPTAVVCVNDLTAVGFMMRAQELGVSVPGDVSVTGYDGIALGTYVRPTLTTVQTSPRRVGRAAARQLLDLIEEGAAPDAEVEPAQVVVRDSIGPVPRD